MSDKWCPVCNKYHPSTTAPCSWEPQIEVSIDSVIAAVRRETVAKVREAKHKKTIWELDEPYIIVTEKAIDRIEKGE